MAFVALIALMLLRRRISGPGIAILAACVLTAVWSADLAFSGLLPEGAGTVLDGFRLSAWLIVLGMLIGMRDQRRGRSLSLPFVLTVGFCLAVAISDTVLVFVEPSFKNGALRGLHDLLRVGIGVAGLLATENLLRNAEQEARHRIWPLCLALGATFAFELFLYADRLMVPGASPIAAAGRGLVGLFAVPLLAVAMARNRDWRVDIHVSRTLVLHTAALVASGVFCMSLAAAGLFVRELGGAWGPQFELLTLVGSAVVLVAVIGIARSAGASEAVCLAAFLSAIASITGRNGSVLSKPCRSPVPGRHAPGTRRQGPRADRGQPGRIALVFAGRAWLCPGGGLEPVGRAGHETAGRSMCFSPVFATAPGFRSGRRRSTAWPFDPTDAWVAIPLAHGDALIAFVHAGSAAERLPPRLGDIRPASRSRASGGQLPRRGALDARAGRQPRVERFQQAFRLRGSRFQEFGQPARDGGRECAPPYGQSRVPQRYAGDA